MKFDCGLCSLQIFNAILLRFSRLLRNSPRPWVKHTRSPATPDSLEKPHQKAKSSMRFSHIRISLTVYHTLSVESTASSYAPYIYNNLDRLGE